MALRHTPEAEVVHAGALGPGLAGARTETLVNAPGLQIFRLVLAAGQRMGEHRVPAGMVLQCLEGELDLEAAGRRLRLRAGDLCHLGPDAPHAVTAHTAASALVTLHGDRAGLTDNPKSSKESGS